MLKTAGSYCILGAEVNAGAETRSEKLKMDFEYP